MHNFQRSFYLTLISLFIIGSLLLPQFSCKWLSSLSGGGDKKMATIQTEFGVIKIRFFPDSAPKHVESFLKLAESGFYNGTTFHRVIPRFMIQGGDPLTKDSTKRELHGTGGPNYAIPAEFSERNHVRGILSAARSADPNSAGSQFFIMVAASPSLDGQYSIFGEVSEGMDVVDKIVAVKTDDKDNPLKPIPMHIEVQKLKSKAEN